MVVHARAATSAGVHESVIVIDVAGLILRFDGGAEQTFGYSADEVIGKNVRLLMPEPYRSEHDQYLADYLRTGEAHIIGMGRRVTATRKGGSDFSAHLSVTEIDVRGVRAFVGILQDITAQVAAEAESRACEFMLDTVSNTVLELTRLGKQAEERELLNQQRFQAIVGNAPSAISVRDVERRYTMVNDAFCQLFGAKSGDVIGRTEDEILPPDVLQRSQLGVLRLLGGESFVEEESIQRGAENILVTTQRFPLRSSGGDIAELVTIRTDITHRKKLEQEAVERATWQERIRTAIGDGRLLVYSQPIVDIATRQTVAEELLVRLRAVDAEGILPPSEFLPQCERYGLMPEIDRYMIGRAIDLARTGRHVSVNITGQTIANATTMEGILEALTIAGPEVTDKIVFEITETTALASPAVAKAFSVSMQDRGCRVALDDFGTGYGTFTELRHLVLYALKIDLSFVQKMLEDRDDERVVKTIISVARTYGLTTIAEGVESQEVLERLAELGADRAQGYFFSKPKPIVW